MPLEYLIHYHCTCGNDWHEHSVTPMATTFCPNCERVVDSDGYSLIDLDLSLDVA